MHKPVVVLVGRPNVGKSTIFNRLVGQRLAIVDDVPGTTRDRLVAEGDWAGHDFFVVDTGGLDPSKQHSQNVLSIGSADFIQEIRDQAEIALEEARHMNLSMPGLALVHQLYKALEAQGHGKKGTQGLMLALERISNMEQ